MSGRRPGWGLLVACFGILLAPWPASGQGGDAVGMITELKVGRGRVEVKPAGATEWRPGRPLSALRAGDTIRATEDASAVILLSGGRGSVKVEATRSPFVLAAGPSGESKAQKARALLESSLGFLAAGRKEPPQAVLATRAQSPPPVVLSPRNGPVLQDSLAFEWAGSRFSRYTVRITGPGGGVLDRKDLLGVRFDYPPGAPPLAAGVRYTFQVLSGAHPPEDAWFEVLDPVRTQAIRRDLTELEQVAGPTVFPNTLVTLQAGLLASRGLIHDARLALLAALAKDPDEPTLYLLLGDLYARTGLPAQAAESFEEARFLIRGNPP